MIGSLWNGISGLDSFQKALEVESNNISNVNTLGYKADEVTFADMMYQDGVGKGAQISSIDKNLDQGSLKMTNSTYDFAIEGEGYFVVNDPKTNDDYFTRAGNFRKSVDGYLETTENLRVKGMVQESFINTGEDTDIFGGTTIPKTDVDPDNVAGYQENYSEFFAMKTGDVTIGDVDYAVSINAKTQNYDHATPETKQTVDDLKKEYGKALEKYLRDPENEEVKTDLKVLHTEVNTALAALVDKTTGNAIVDDNGESYKLMQIESRARTSGLGVAALEPIQLSLKESNLQYGDFGTPEIDGEKIYMKDVQGNKYLLGVLTPFSFTDKLSLYQEGGSMFSPTVNSGDPIYSGQGESRVVNGSVELSNANLTEALTSLLVYQRGFEANAKAVTASDEFLNTAIQLKR